jgi:hypothetical protein
MKVTPELVARIVETAYAGQADGVDLPTAKNDAISAVFGGGVRRVEAVKPVVKAKEKKSLRDALVHATDEELTLLEQKLTAAENAPHKNGEVTAVEAEVEKLTNRIKF